VTLLLGRSSKRSSGVMVEFDYLELCESEEREIFFYTVMHENKKRAVME
jgi:hypothetical protein